MTTSTPRRVLVEGELTIRTAAEHKQRLLAALHDGVGGVQLDLSGVSELDAAGLQVLLLVQREGAKEGIAVQLHDPSPAVTEVFAVAHLSKPEV